MDPHILQLDEAMDVLEQMDHKDCCALIKLLSIVLVGRLDLHVACARAICFACPLAMISQDPESQLPLLPFVTSYFHL